MAQRCENSNGDVDWPGNIPIKENKINSANTGLRSLEGLKHGFWKQEDCADQEGAEAFAL